MWTRTKKTESHTHLQWEEDNLFFSRNLLDFRRHRKCNMFSAHFSDCLHHYTRTCWNTGVIAYITGASAEWPIHCRQAHWKFMKQRHKCSKTVTQGNRASNRPKPWTETACPEYFREQTSWLTRQSNNPVL
jgi:hypothetical protein